MFPAKPRTPRPTTTHCGAPRRWCRRAFATSSRRGIRRCATGSRSTTPDISGNRRRCCKRYGPPHLRVDASASCCGPALDRQRQPQAAGAETPCGRATAGRGAGRTQGARCAQSHSRRWICRWLPDRHARSPADVEIAAIAAFQGRLGGTRDRRPDMKQNADLGLRGSVRAPIHALLFMVMRPR